MTWWKKISHLGILALATSLSSCDVHQFPVEETPEPIHLVLDLDYTTDLPLYKELQYPQGTAQSIVSRLNAEYQLRHTVKLYSTTDITRATWSRAEADYSTTVYTPISSDLSSKITMDVPDGSYTAMVWTDYVPVEGPAQPFYNIENFDDIHYTDIRDYIGSTDLRDAYRGDTDFVLPDHELIEDAVQTVHVDMRRPLGKYVIIATDVEQFISRTLSRQGLEAPPKIDSRGFDFSKYRVRLVYSGYLPTSFNMFLNKPVDSTLGVSYFSDIKLLSDTEATLCFDYVMVNGSEAKVDAVVQIVDENDQIMAQSSPMRIPLVRGKLTEVRGDFLTATSSSGVSINTKFDGEYNIEIHY